MEVLLTVATVLCKGRSDWHSSLSDGPQRPERSLFAKLERMFEFKSMQEYTNMDTSFHPLYSQCTATLESELQLGPAEVG